MLQPLPRFLCGRITCVPLRYISSFVSPLTPRESFRTTTLVACLVVVVDTRTPRLLAACSHNDGATLLGSGLHRVLDTRPEGWASDSGADAEAVGPGVANGSSGPNACLWLCCDCRHAALKMPGGRFVDNPVTQAEGAELARQAREVWAHGYQRRSSVTPQSNSDSAASGDSEGTAPVTPAGTSATSATVSNPVTPSLTRTVGDAIAAAVAPLQQQLNKVAQEAALAAARHEAIVAANEEEHVRYTLTLNDKLAALREMVAALRASRADGAAASTGVAAASATPPATLAAAATTPPSPATSGDDDNSTFHSDDDLPDF